MLDCNAEDPGVDPIYGIQKIIKKDPREVINLTIGVYRTMESPKPPVLEVVKKAEKILLDLEDTKNYLPISGDSQFLDLTADLVFGDEQQSNRILKFQSIGGTSALSLGFSYLQKNGYTKVCVSDPTWANHAGIILSKGLLLEKYPYLNGLKQFHLIEDVLNKLEENTIVLLHASCHNPTGLDFTKEQWKSIADICDKKGLIPFFDSAYQGFGSSLEEDAWAIRYFYQKGLDFLVAHSFSKSFSMYNERVGALFLITNNDKQNQKIERVMNKLIRVDYSNPPNHGSNCIKLILSDPSLRALWEKELSLQRESIKNWRVQLADQLHDHVDAEIEHLIRSGNGFFCLLPYNSKDIERLKKEFAIYLTQSGRMNLAGLNSNNFPQIVNALKSMRN